MISRKQAVGVGLGALVVLEAMMLLASAPSRSDAREAAASDCFHTHCNWFFVTCDWGGNTSCIAGAGQCIELTCDPDKPGS